ncbi:hypothetical protein TNCV_4620681 [Trichonephila clavipes]|nr:hypothetical protein TNCV_4620681 [Trichonephila clavipes]
MLAQRLARDTPPVATPPVATPNQLWQYVEAAWTAVPQEYIQNLFDSMLRQIRRTDEPHTEKNYHSEKGNEGVKTPLPGSYPGHQD